MLFPKKLIVSLLLQAVQLSLVACKIIWQNCLQYIKDILSLGLDFQRILESKDCWDMYWNTSIKLIYSVVFCIVYIDSIYLDFCE